VSNAGIVDLAKCPKQIRPQAQTHFMLIIITWFEHSLCNLCNIGLENKVIIINMKWVCACGRICFGHLARSTIPAFDTNNRYHKLLLRKKYSLFCITPEFTPGYLWGSCYSIFSFMCIFCRSLFVLLSFFFLTLCCLSFFFWPLCCLFFFFWSLHCHLIRCPVLKKGKCRFGYIIWYCTMRPIMR
jgi:hypothetical protein